MGSKSLSSLVKDAKRLLASRANTDEFKAQIEKAIHKKDRTSLEKVMRQSIIKGPID